MPLLWRGRMVGSKSGNYSETAEKPVKNCQREQMNRNTILLKFSKEKRLRTHVNKSKSSPPDLCNSTAPFLSFEPLSAFVHFIRRISVRDSHAQKFALRITAHQHKFAHVCVNMRITSLISIVSLNSVSK